MMSRTIAVIICFIASLFLIPVLGDCFEIQEYGNETEVECCAVSYSCIQSDRTEPKTERSVVRDTAPAVTVPVVATRAYFRIRPARILNCVFRE